MGFVIRKSPQIYALLIAGFLFSTALTIFRGPLAAAVENPDPAETVVRQMIDSIRKLRTTSDPSIRAKLIESVNESLALDSLSAQALDGTWSKLTAAQRDRFRTLLCELLERVAYPQATGFFANLDVQYGQEQAVGARRVVPTTVKRPEGGAVSINYVLQITNGSWRVVDINLDGQSLAQNVSSQIQAVLKQSSYDGLIRQMEARLKQQSN